MLHCFQCGADLPDNLAYCLHCGARLEIDDDPTVVDPPIVIPIDARPAPYEPRPISVEPKKGGGMAKFILGGLIGAGTVIVFLVVLGIVLFSMQGDQSQTNTTGNLNSANTPSPTPTPTPTLTPRKATPTPSPEIDDTDTSGVTRTCDIVNPAGGTVNLRRYCDTRDCSLDASTLYIQAEQGDIVELTSRKPVTTGRFTWVQVKYGGEVLWISSTGINCD